MALKFRWETKFKEIECGEIPINWHFFTIQDIVENIQKGKVPRKTEGDEIYPYLSTEYLRGDIEAKRYFSKDSGVFIKEGDLIVLFDGSNSGEIFEGKEGILSSTMAKVELTDTVHKKYVFYYLKYIEDDIKSSKTGSDDRHLDKNAFLSTCVPFPGLPEQLKLVSILSWFDELIENKQRQIRILEQIATVTFKNWFIDYDPFKDNGMKRSCIGEIPKEWDTKSISSIAEMKNGLAYFGTEKKDEKLEGSYLFVTLNNILEGGGFKADYYWIKSERLKERHFLNEGDLIIANVHFGVGGSEVERLLAAPAIVVFPPNYDAKEAVYSMDTTRIIPFEKYYKYYLYIYLKLTKEDSASFSTGTSILHLDLENFKNNKIIVCPPKPILIKYHSLAERVFNKINNNQKEILVLRKVRDTLLPLLVFGKLRVEEI